MATRDQVESTLARVGLLALTYYPEITIDDPEYDLASEVSWCLQDLDERDASTIRDDITRVIVDPTARRVAAYAALFDLPADE